MARGLTKRDLAGRGLHHLVTNNLGARIVSGELPTNAQIVLEDVESELGVSRTVVREALRDLQAKGMVTARPKAGTRVLPLEYWNLLDEEVIAWRVATPARDKQLRDLMQLRLAVELSALRSACVHAQEDDFATLLRMCDDMESALVARDQTGFTRADNEFHSRVLEASGNLVYRHFQSPFAAALRALDDDDRLGGLPEAEVVDRHRAVVEALRLNDPDRAVALTEEFIAGGGELAGMARASSF